MSPAAAVLPTTRRWSLQAVEAPRHRPPRFLLRYFEHHRKPPPLLGVFEVRNHNIVFTPILDPPDRIRLDLRLDYSCDQILGCRHGRVLLMNLLEHNIVVWDPITNEQHNIDAPPVFQ
jgi:hypothetical protein